MELSDLLCAHRTSVQEKERREKEKEEFKKAQELENLRRAFKRIDKSGDNHIDCDELLAEVRSTAHACMCMCALAIAAIAPSPQPILTDRGRCACVCTCACALQLEFLGYTVRPSEAALTIWEVDDDADGQIDWDEFKSMFYRIRDDASGYEPRKLFNVVEFIMHDKNHNGHIDLDEAITILYQRYGKVGSPPRTTHSRTLPSGAAGACVCGR